MKLRIIAGGAFFLNTFFFATYYSVAKEALGRIDPIVFTFFEMVTLVPFALVIILCSWRDMTRAVIKRGVLLGSVLCLALFTIAIALKYTTATSTAFFPALNGFIAALIAFLVLRQPLKGKTWLAGLLSLTGAALLILTSSAGNARGTLIAFLGGLFYTLYVFLCDHEQKDEKAAWPLFGIELLSTAVWASLVALLFGDWQSVHPAFPKDIWVVLYVAIICTFIPTLITVLLQKYISAVTVSFIYVLEPVLGAIIAALYLHEELSLAGYLGGGLVVIGALIQAWGPLQASSDLPVSEEEELAAPAAPASWVTTQLYPGLCSLLGGFLLYILGGMPPASWQEVYTLWPRLSEQGNYATLLLVQAGGWLIAWISVLIMGGLALYHILRHVFLPEQDSEPVQEQMSPLRDAVGGVAERQIIQPTYRVRPGTFLPEQHMPVQTPMPPLHRPVYTPENQIPPVQRIQEQPQVQRVRTVLMPEQSAWYGHSSWNPGPGPETPLPMNITGPLQPEGLHFLENNVDAASFIRRNSLERLDA